MFCLFFAKVNDAIFSQGTFRHRKLSFSPLLPSSFIYFFFLKTSFNSSYTFTDLIKWIIIIKELT
jgi:hypothetical protein